MSGVWEFDGRDGRGEVLHALVLRQVEPLADLLPDDHEDPMQRLAAEFDGAADSIVSANPVLARLFPPALEEAEDAARFRRDALTTQVRARIEAARTMLGDLEGTDGVVLVPLEHADAWVMTMAGLRAQWNVELTGSQERMAEATFADTMRNPTAAAVADWLGYLVEDLLEARADHEEGF